MPEGCDHDWLLHVDASPNYGGELKFMDVCLKCNLGKIPDIEELKKREISELVIHDVEKNIKEFNDANTSKYT